MQIRNRPIGPSHPPYVIAEVSCNHAGSEAVAHALIQVAKDAGAEAVKFQFYTPEGMVEMGDAPMFHVITEGPWAGKTMYDLYDKAQMPWEWGPRLKARCHDLGLAFIASAYDVDGLDWLMQHCVPDALKVASFEATDTPFVEAMASKGLPLIVSLGMEPHLATVVKATRGKAIYLHCVSAYPTIPQHANLGQNGLAGLGACDCCGHIGEYPDEACWNCHDKTQFDVKGFSDHTLGHSVACAAVAKGACVLEKHIQLHPAIKTADSHFSATPEEFTAYCRNVREAWEACQPVVGDPEKDSRQFRRAPGGKRGSYRA